MEKQWKNCGFDVWPLWSRSMEIKPWNKTTENYGSYFCTFQLRPLQRDKNSCVPGTTSPRSTLFPASSLFLSFFFAPTFALPWLSFLPSQVNLNLLQSLYNILINGCSCTRRASTLPATRVAIFCIGLILVDHREFDIVRWIYGKYWFAKQNFLAVFLISASSFAKQVPTTEELGEDGVGEREAWSEARKSNGKKCEHGEHCERCEHFLNDCTVLTLPSSDIQRHSANWLCPVLVSSCLQCHPYVSTISTSTVRRLTSAVTQHQFFGTCLKLHQSFFLALLLWISPCHGMRCRCGVGPWHLVPAAILAILILYQNFIAAERWSTSRNLGIHRLKLNLLQLFQTFQNISNLLTCFNHF